MNKSVVSLVRYQEPLKSVQKAVELANGFEFLKSKSKVFIKPNIVNWTMETNFPKWGVITTSRVVEDMIILLKEHGIDDITIAEGTVTNRPGDKKTPAHAHESLGYHKLKKRYGIEFMDIMDRPFRKIDLGRDVVLEYNSDILECDFIINLPVLKTHSQAKASIGIKNMKGMVSLASRKLCHSSDTVKNLDFYIAGLANKLPPMFTLADGIYTLELGPNPDGRGRRSNILLASNDVFSLDMAGAKLLGFEPGDIPHLVHASVERGRKLDLSDVEIVGERIEELAYPHRWEFKYNEDGTLPIGFEKRGIKGIHYYKYDNTMCTYCTILNMTILMAIAMAWKGVPFDDIEILTGKRMSPRPGMKKTILLGKCMYQAHKDNKEINEMIPIKGCPPSPAAAVKALKQAGIEIDPELFENIEKGYGYYMRKYEGNPEFDESFYRVS